MNPLLRSGVTTTTIFILPMLFPEGSKYFKVLKADFVNAYIADFDKPEHDDKILVARKVDRKRLKPLGKPIDIYIKKSDDEGVSNLQVEVYDVPKEYVDDYYRVISGNYSYLTDEYKQHIISFWDQKKESDIAIILYKSIKHLGLSERHYITTDGNTSKVKEFYPPFRVVDETLDAPSEIQLK